MMILRACGMPLTQRAELLSQIEELDALTLIHCFDLIFEISVVCNSVVKAA